MSLPKRKIPKSATLVFRGIECELDAVELLMGRPADQKGRAGDPVKPGVKTSLKRSYVSYEIELDIDCRLDQALPILLSELGGVEKLVSVRNAVLPEFFELDLTWPVKNSEEQEGGFFPASLLAELAELECTLSFGFV